MLFRLDFQSAVPIYRQIRDQVVLAVAQGELTPGERLPTTRALAEDAGVNTTVNSLRREAVQKLNLYKPENIGQASRISGASCSRPRDISSPTAGPGPWSAPRGARQRACLPTRPPG